MSATGYSATLAIRFVTIECSKCHVVFAVDGRTDDRLRKSHETFYCPFGHSQYFPGDSTEEKLKKQVARQEEELERERQRTATARAEANLASYRERGQKAAKTRLKNRIAAGVCPCCTRSFSNVQRHIEHMHPEYVKNE